MTIQKESLPSVEDQRRRLEDLEALVHDKPTDMNSQKGA